MNHQPFEDYIFQEELTHEEQVQLRKHLASCPDCNRLQQAMKGIERTFSDPIQVSPKANFAIRWQRMAIEREDENQQTAAWFMMAGLIALMTVLAYLNFGSNWFTNFHPLQFMVGSSVNLIQTATSLYNTVTSFLDVFRSIPGNIIFVVSLVIGAISFFWIVIWFSAMRRILSAQRKAI